MEAIKRRGFKGRRRERTMEEHHSEEESAVDREEIQRKIEDKKAEAESNALVDKFNSYSTGVKQDKDMTEEERKVADQRNLDRKQERIDRI